jgi:hypothetical protein
MNMPARKRYADLLRAVGAYVVVFALVSLCWRDVFAFYFPGVDEWNFFAMFASSRGGGELVSFILAPYIGHVVPLFKGFLYLEFSVFGLSPAPYHWVSLLLFSVCLMLLLRFLASETGDRVLAAAMTAFLGMNSVYYPVLMWMMHHQVLLCLMFLLLALITVARMEGTGGTGEHLTAGGFCMLAALSYGMGVLSWPLVIAYYVLRRRREGEARKNPRPVFLMLGPAVLFFLLYFFASPGSGGAGELTLNPLLLLPGIAGFLGNILVESSGFTFPPLLAEFLGMEMTGFYEDREAAMVFLGINTAVFLLSGALVTFVTWKADRRLRAAFFLGIIWAVLATALLLVSRMEHYGGVGKMTNIPRYHFFPLVGLVVAAVPSLAYLRRRYGRRFLAAAVAILVLFGLVHQRRLGDLAQLDREEIRERKRTVSFLRSKMRGSRSGYVEEYPGMNLSAVPYEKFLVVFADEEDRLSSRDGMVLILREHRSVRDEEMEVFSGGNFRRGFMEAGGEPVRLEIRVRAPGTHQHLSFRAKSDSPVEGMLTCIREGGGRSTVPFSVEAGWFWREYLLPCPRAQRMHMEMEPGAYAIRDMKLYW